MRAIEGTTKRHWTAISSESAIAAFALLALLVAQWMLSSAIHHTNYTGSDGKMAQATILAAMRFAKPLNITSINPIEGIGSQLLPLNVWVNPAYWPFAFLEKELATELSALIALGLFAAACYIMARCFDVPILPSAIAAQLCIVLFAPVVLIFQLPTVFSLNAGNAVVYAPYMIALGLLSRLEADPRSLGVTAAAIFSLLFYSVYCDPLWVMICTISWAVPFAVVTFGSPRLKTILIRGAALGFCLGLFLLIGIAEYLYTLSQYTARIQFAEALDRTRVPQLVSALFSSPDMKFYYWAWSLGWLLGLLTLRGRSRVLIAAALAGCVAYLAYSVIYLLLENATWVLPIPIYVEQCLFALFLTAGVAGYWGALRTVASWLLSIGMMLPHRIGIMARSSRIRFAAMVVGILIVAIVPATAVNFAVNHSQQYTEIWNDPWPTEPELEQYLVEKIGLTAGQQFRGSLQFRYDPENAIVDLWSRGIPTADEYSQLVAPQALYFVQVMLQKEVRRSLNWFWPFPDSECCWPKFWKAVQMFGVRYLLADRFLASADENNYPVIKLPRHPRSGASGIWQIYELPRPNVGDYSPTQVVTGRSSNEIMTAMGVPDFDFTKQVVLTALLDEPLVPARDMRLTVIRGGLHVSGKSDGTSLVVLPQQFSHCLRARDSRVRFVRANLLMAGMVFSGEIDTDIVFNYGIFSPGCRRADLAEFKRLDMRIDLRMPHLTGDRLFPDWDDAAAKLHAAAIAMGLLSAKTPDPPEDPAPSGPIVTQETVLAELPKVMTEGFAVIGIRGLNAEVEPGDPVVAGQPILRLVAVPTNDRHYLATHSTSLHKNQVYRITAWIKVTAEAKVEMQLSDKLDPRGGQPANQGLATFDPATRVVSISYGNLKGWGIEQGPDGWQKTWVDLATVDGQIVLAFGLVSRKGNVFKGDGRLGLTLGGIEVAARN
jgi:hypothetical protein